MKKMCIFLVVLFVACLVACSSAAKTLHCDGENCSNMVVVGDENMDESAVVYCDSCSSKLFE